MNNQQLIEYHAKRDALLQLGNAARHHARLATRNKPRVVSRRDAKKGRKQRSQDMHEFWKHHVQYNPAIL